MGSFLVIYGHQTKVILLLYFICKTITEIFSDKCVVKEKYFVLSLLPYNELHFFYLIVKQYPTILYTRKNIFKWKRAAFPYLVRCMEKFWCRRFLCKKNNSRTSKLNKYLQQNILPFVVTFNYHPTICSKIKVTLRVCTRDQRILSSAA